MSRESALEIMASLSAEARGHFELRIALDAHSQALDIRFCPVEADPLEIAAPKSVEARSWDLTSSAALLTAISALRK